jgi:capsular polysaccharide transport system permease protein
MLNTREKPTVRIDALPARGEGGFLSKLRKGRALEATSELRELSVRRKPRWWGLVFVLIGMSPTIAAGIYLTALSQDRYVSIASFVVRTASKPTGSSGFGALLQMAGFSRSDDDVFSIQDFMRSREAAAKLNEQLPLREYFAHSGRDIVLSYPSFLYGPTEVEFHKYLQHFIDVTYSSTTGITTLTVQAFRPEDAYAIATTLLALAEDKVNELNTRIRSDAIRVAQDQVARSEARLTNATVEVTAFRNKEMLLDPGKSSVMLAELIGRLGSDLAQAQSLASEKESNSPNDPGLSALRQRASSLENQIQTERGKIADSSTGLADKLADYERLTMEGDFAKEALKRSLDALGVAHTEARRQQLFLERIVNPAKSDYPTEPRKGWILFTIFMLNGIGLTVVYLFRTGLREHVQMIDG